ncbi:CPBP family glutamic-type intramembrane protease [Clavibacter phaseoli]|uniref:CPBP family glutamic-type intramembrane protease n=1 Tax=Clavibacter phaseoli TaxID=1734031 RepID=UPI000E6711EB|nr:CPBP family glutamic-type intramembrane protease [Clavibacter phaseoli]RIJ59023.1 CPBP family intramembrane metalloprotease [Clavibacter phaseoli]
MPASARPSSAARSASADRDDPAAVPADPRLDAQTRRPQPWIRAVAVALLAWIALGAGLGLAIGIAEAVTEATGGGLLPKVVLQAVLMSALVVPAVVLLRRRLDRRSLAGLGLSRRIGRPIALGVGVGAVTGAVVWVPAGFLGWIRVDGFDLAAFAGFLLLNGVVLALYEAIPEELALRGYMWTNLRDGTGLVVATVVTTALFPAIGLVIESGRWIVRTLAGSDTGAFTPIPEGSDAIAYVLQLVLFGLALVAARRIPMEGALLIAMAFHWTQLTVTRVLLGGMGWASSGWDVAFVEPDAIALVLVHIVLAGLVFVAVRKRMERRQPELRQAHGARVQETDLR